MLAPYLKILKTGCSGSICFVCPSATRKKAAPRPRRVLLQHATFDSRAVCPQFGRCWGGCRRLYLWQWSCVEFMPLVLVFHAISLAMHCPKTRHISTCATCDPAARGWHLKPRSRAAKHLGTHRYTQIQEKIKNCWNTLLSIVYHVYHMCIICVSYVYHIICVSCVHTKNCWKLLCRISISLIAHSQLPYFSRAALWLDLFVSCTWRLRLWEDPVTKSWF